MNADATPRPFRPHQRCAGRDAAFAPASFSILRCAGNWSSKTQGTNPRQNCSSGFRRRRHGW